MKITPRLFAWVMLLFAGLLGARLAAEIDGYGQFIWPVCVVAVVALFVVGPPRERGPGD